MQLYRLAVLDRIWQTFNIGYLMVPLNRYASPACTAYEKLQNELLSCATSNRNVYTQLAEKREKVIGKIEEILLQVSCIPDQRAYIEAKHAQELQLTDPKTYNLQAYEFLKGDLAHFNGKGLNFICIREDIQNLKAQAVEARLISQVFEKMLVNEAFQNDPAEYIEKWRKAVIAQRVALNCFDEVESKTPYNWRCNIL